MKLEHLRWFTRFCIAISELGVIFFITYFIFFSEKELQDGWLNIVATIVGGLLLNFGTMSKYLFSIESEHPVEQNETKRPLLPEGTDKEPDGHPAGHQQ